MLGGCAWLTSVILAVIGRPSKDVGLQFSEMSARNVADVFMVSAIFVGKCEQSVICADLDTSVRVYYTALENYCILMLPAFLSCAIFQF